MFDWFKKKENVQAVVNAEDLVKYIGWSTGMWVMTADGAGILTSIGEECEVHLADVYGNTKLVVLLPILSLRQCTWDEVPEARRGITRELALSLGYK